MKALNEKKSYQELLHLDPVVSNTLTSEEIDSCFTLEYYMENVDYIYKRIGLLED